MNEDEIYQECIQRWGLISQLDMTVEECAELIKAVNKWKRGKGTFNDMVEEAVDVQLMINQIKSTVNSDVWQELIDRKLTRLRKIMEDEDARKKEG
jgi:NTP pyrophosphatase (non-canonical NTP hydrolase)